MLVAVSAPSLLGDATPPAVYLSLPFCLAGMLMVAQVGSGLRQGRAAAAVLATCSCVVGGLVSSPES